jgi:glyoxylase-like metal-dependent hydrolase (beta-lactamase superfamily II)
MQNIHASPFPVEPLSNLEIAGYQVFSVPTGIFGLDGGAMFGTVPKVLWAKCNPADANNRIPMEARALLLKGHGRVILIDTGNGADFVVKYGEKLGSKFGEMYGVDPSGTNLESSLKKNGFTPDDITDVILTHLHFDHAGGAVKASPQGELIPTFPLARYYIRESNLKTAQRPNIRERASYLPANFEPLLSRGVLHVLRDDEPLGLPGLQFFLSHGHTLGQQIVWVKDDIKLITNSVDDGLFEESSEGGQGRIGGIVYGADLIPTSSHVRLAWVMGYDLEPLRLIEEKMKILGMAADEKLLLFFEHDPYCDLAEIERDGSDFRVVKRFSLSLN